ncbi:outer membrane beta-barrel protein [Mucilaginibacter myungsuensis]|uniref:PorT family protein n=1 Tax=Mucilaginibacter myungsuensis TaxID=649104 RepID=A0A929KSA0_9SPHI|nr:outer membrane beta-barrel protein [Mucilaginibacter myungsuensis]MBE9660579.1 PorT family protein [Mucilaginibacter myungsuensis]MDN3600623.1 outer membrane beta-barrel protein [Mucilaginibacter myungsuensis]
MRYIWLLIVACFCFATNANAQTKGYNEWGIGYGYNGSMVNIGSEIRGSNRGGINLLLSIDHYLSEKWSVKGKLQYDMKGWGSSNSLDSPEKDIKLDHELNYLSLPILINFHFGQGKAFYTHLGPYGAVLLSGKKIDNGVAVKPDVSRMNMGILWGFGGQVRVKDNVKFFAEFNVLGTFIGAKRSADGNKYHNGVSALTIGFNF